MKTILNKIGAVSRATIVGVSLGVATAGVGVFTASMFLSGDDGASGLSGQALGQYASSSGQNQNGNMYTREQLEASMAAAQSARDNANSVYSLSGAGEQQGFAVGRAAAARDQQGAEGGLGAPSAVNSMGGPVGGGGDFGEGMLGAGIEGMGGGGISAIDVGAVPVNTQGQLSAGRAGISGNSGGSEGGEKGALATGRTMSGQQVRAGGLQGTSGGSATMLGAQAAAAEHRAGQDIPQGSAANLPGSDNLNARATGRGSGFDNSNQAAGQGTETAAEQERSSASKSDMSVALNYSRKGVEESKFDEAAGLEAMAFSGGGNEGIPFEGGAPNLSDPNYISDLGKAYDPNIKTSLEDPVVDINTQKKLDEQRATDIKKQLKNKLGMAIGIAFAAGLSVMFLSEMAHKGGPYAWALWLAAAAVIAISMVGIIMIMLAGENSMLGLIKEWAGLEYGGTGHKGWKTATIITYILLLPIPALGLLGMLGGGKIGAAFGKLAGILAGALGLGAAGMAMSGFGGKGKPK